MENFEQWLVGNHQLIVYGVAGFCSVIILLLIVLSIRLVIKAGVKMGGSQNNLLGNINYEEKEDFERGFRAYFNEHIRPELLSLEKQRIEKISSIKKGKPMAIKLAIIGAIGGFYVGGFDLLMLCSIGPVLWFFFSLQQTNSRRVKEVVIPKIFSFFGTFQYQKDGRISESLLRKMDILPKYQKYSSEDYVHGKYKDVEIEFSEAQLMRYSFFAKRGRKEEYVFIGIFLLLEMKKSFRGKTIITTDSGTMLNWAKDKIKAYSGMERVQLEDPKFEALFQVYSTDQIEARHILTPSFMERVMKLAEVYNSKEIQCSFLENRMFITIPTQRNLFEPSFIYESLINTNDIRKFLAQIHDILQVIEVLKLDKKYSF